MHLPATTERVKEHTNPKINAEIEAQIEENIKFYRDKSREEIKARIDELNREWDTERVLEANASSLVLSSSILALTVNRKWAILSGVVGGFLLQHALQGWCPPLEVIRRMKIRTSSEINKEKIALIKLLEER
ncbi:YgaP family membrane protein [Bacillus thermotolerans]|uniref:Inner membrane protein YgaP-like transmembrane domain-containing protein n=1 Tax=Bacillus thermotolerans TaxID=1221996 RepID=A0A0F5HRB1_BACTR|nr:DUF2892 domain-containing protein [Bacillus thermotolerans]KKB33542.1 hypothetical protein QY97_03215 [Bacillus thermotolerans]KKB34039.1 hypothetical protein QY96_00280 [Bacillus thermotolerans]KKB35803.1 hypothetical protein QY95_03293 [Bacillus thermotolerans]